jgi:solute carrier family 25 (mitochondrial adenine nucleotide translocator), member 4/5/6/31
MDFLKSFVAGGISAAVSKTGTAPIERVKLIMQTQDINPRVLSGEIPRYTGIINCFQRVSSEQGVAALWRGNWVNILRYFPTQAFNFAFKDTIKPYLPKTTTKMGLLGVNMAAGGIAGGGSLAIVYPLHYARTRLACDVGCGKQTFTGLGDCFRKTIKGPGGFMALYNGFGVGVAGIIPFRGIFFGVNDTLASMNPYQHRTDFVGLASKFTQAQIAAVSANYVPYPFDTICRRLQMQSEKAQADWIYKGTMDCFRKVVADEGVSALFKGAGANALRTVGAAWVLVGYGEIMTLMG